MTPQERQLVDELFDRLSRVEGAPRDPDAASAIAQGLRNAPNALYTLVQTVLLQDEALKRANSRIQELEQAHAGEQNQSGGFLDSMRDTILGQGQPRGSVPNVAPPPVPNRPDTMIKDPMGMIRGPMAREPTARVKAMVKVKAMVRDRMAASPTARSKRRSAAVVARSWEPRRRPRPEWSADRCCSTVSAR